MYRVPKLSPMSANISQITSNHPQLTLSEASAALRVSIATLARWRRSGLVRTVQLGARPRVPEAEVLRLLEQGSGEQEMTRK